MTLKEFATKGGKARAKALSPLRRIEIARNAGIASALKRKESKPNDNRTASKAN